MIHRLIMMLFVVAELTKENTTMDINEKISELLRKDALYKEHPRRNYFAQCCCNTCRRYKLCCEKCIWPYRPYVPDPGKVTKQYEGDNYEPEITIDG